MNEVSGLSFRSDFNSKDFEPNTRLDIEVNMRYIHSNNVAKLSVVINDNFFIDAIFNVYKRIIAVFADNSYQLTLSGYSFLLPNYYGAASFSSGILRKFNMPCSLENLASWYSSADLVNGTLGLLNCFSDLSVEQNKYLFNIFGEENVYVTNNITAVYNVAAESESIADYIESDDYNCKCLKLEKSFRLKN